MKGLLTPSPQDKTRPPSKARGDWFTAFFCPNFYFSKMLWLQSIAFLSIPFYPSVPAQRDRWGKDNNEAGSVFKFAHRDPYFIYWHSPLIWSSNNLKWDFMQDLFSTKSHTQKNSWSSIQVSFCIKFSDIQLKLIYVGSTFLAFALFLLSRIKVLPRQHHCRNLELERFHNLKCWTMWFPP